MSNDKKKRAREIASALVKNRYTDPVHKELGELVLELIEGPTLEETGWTPGYAGTIAIDDDGDEVILVAPRKDYDGDPAYLTLWKGQEDRLIILEQDGMRLRPTGRYANASSVLKNKEEQQ